MSYYRVRLHIAGLAMAAALFLPVLVQAKTLDAPSAATKFVRIHSSDSLLTSVTEFEQLDKVGVTWAPYATVVRNHLSLFQASYELRDDDGVLQGYSRSRIFSMSSLFDWWVQLDVYDAALEPVGRISGELFTLGAGRFAMYDAAGERQAVAYLDRSGTVCTISAADNFSRRLGRMKRVLQSHSREAGYELGLKDPWDLEIYAANDVDHRVLHTFAAFLVDRQNAFVPRPDVDVED